MLPDSRRHAGDVLSCLIDIWELENDDDHSFDHSPPGLHDYLPFDRLRFCGEPRTVRLELAPMAGPGCQWSGTAWQSAPNLGRRQERQVEGRHPWTRAR